MNDDRQRDLLDFWFGAPGTPGCDEPREIWFKTDPAFDAALRQRFGALHREARDGALDGWGTTAEGALALVILLDQLPRNLHRGTPAAFACDGQARAAARRALAAGFDRDLPPVQRQFLYLPFEHSEDLADQEDGVRLFASLPEGAFRDNCVDFARRHHAIVARFGRFPHRNRALGRATSAAETAFLTEPNSSFG